MRGVLQPDHIPKNKFEFSVLGIIPITFTSVKGLEEKLDSVELPDKTRASGGRTGPSEIKCMLPAHHTAEFLALEAWFREGKDPVSPTYKKPATLNFPSISGQGGRSLSLIGVFITNRVMPDFEMKDSGEMAEIEYTFSIDELVVL